MTITLGNMLFRVFAAVSLAMICAACGVPKLVEVKGGSHSYQDSLLVTVVLNDSVFTEQEISDFVRLDSTVFPNLRPTPQFDSLQRVRRPIATMIVTNLASIPIRVPLAKWYSRRGLGNDDFPVVYSIGNATGALNPPLKPIMDGSLDVTNMLWYSDRRFVTIQPNQSLILEDSIDVLSLSAIIYESSNYPPGRYWIAFTYSNIFIRQGKNNYWTGSISTDTVYFEIK